MKYFVRRALRRLGLIKAAPAMTRAEAQHHRNVFLTHATNRVMLAATPPKAAPSVEQTSVLRL